MTRLTKLASAALIALTLAAAASAPVQPLAGDPLQWGVERVAESGDTGTSKGGDIPVTPG